MPNAAAVNISVTNLTQNVEVPSSGVNFILGQSVRGPFANPETLITSWSQFVANFGGLLTGSDAPLLAKRLLERGGALRFCRVGHYTDPTDASTLDATKAVITHTNLITFDAALITANEVDADVDGNAITTVPFNTDNDTTLQDLADEILLADGVLSATVLNKGVVGTEGNRQIRVISSKGIETLIANVAVTAGASQAGAVITLPTKFLDKDGNLLFTIVPKNKGADYNDFTVEIKAGSNGGADYFDVVLTHTTDGITQEEYRNLTIGEPKSAAESTFLEAIVNGSSFFDVEYEDLQSLTEPLLPITFFGYYFDGSDGTAVQDTDYVGDSNAGTGFFAFDSYDDAYNIAAFDNESDSVHVAGSAYAATRKDLVYFLHIPNSFTTQTAIINKKDAYLVDDKHTHFSAGGLKIKDPITGQDKNISEVGDILALANNSAKNFGEWFSFAGPQRGKINGVLGVVNNFGAAGNFDQLNALANRQINMVVLRDNSVKLWGNFSGQLKNDQEKYMNIVRLVLFLKKSLRPTLEEYLEEPNDIPTWKRIFYAVKPFMDGLITKRAIFSYDWQGDQDASSLNDLVVNNATDVSNGKYKINLPIKAIASLQEINVNIILTPAGVDFEVVNELI